MDLQDLDSLVDSLDETRAEHQVVDGTDPALPDGPGPVGDFISGSGAAENGMAGVLAAASSDQSRGDPPPQALDSVGPALPVRLLSSYSGVHLKGLSCDVVECGNPIISLVFRVAKPSPSQGRA